VIDLYGPDPKTNLDYSRVINAREVSRLAGLIDPAKVAAGGRSDPNARYLDPTILYPIAWDDPIMEDEVFGPILPILTSALWMKLSSASPPRPILSRPSFSAATRRPSTGSSVNSLTVAAR
jgi:hypothetical protein